MRAMKIAAVQMVSTPDVARNLDAAGRLIAAGRRGRRGAGGAARVLLPAWAGATPTSWRWPRRRATGPIQGFLADTARAHGIWLVGGTLPVRTAACRSRVLNRCCVYAPDGRQAAHYDKIHLFAFDNGRESYDEGRTLRAGSEPVALQAGARCAWACRSATTCASPSSTAR